MENKIILPRGYLSYSAIMLWETNKEAYRKRYYYGEEGYSNKGMSFGRQVAKELESKEKPLTEEMQTLKILLPKYDVAEKKLTAEIKTKDGIINLLGYVDSYRNKDHAIREYKTGKVPWTQRKVDSHPQLDMYAAIVYINEQKLPKELWLDWIETQYTDKGVELTGRIESFQTDRGVLDAIRMINRIKQAAIEISQDYQQELKNIS
jgi:hypothetical protein